MKLEAKVKGAVIGNPDEVMTVLVDEDYVEADEDTVRAYIIDELYIMLQTEPVEIDEAGLEILNMKEIIEDLSRFQSTSD